MNVNFYETLMNIFQTIMFRVIELQFFCLQ